MLPIRVLIINTMESFQGDTTMLMMGVSQLKATDFHIYAVCSPRGAVYNYLQSLPNVTLIPMELGGQESAPPRPLGTFQQQLETVVALPRIVALIKREQIDIIYTIDRTIAMTIAYLVSMVTRRPLLYGAHITFYLKESKRHQMAIRHAKRITVVSEEMRKQFLPFVAHPDQLCVLPNAVKIDKYDHTLDGSKIRAECNLPKHIDVVTIIGRIDPWKGQKELVKAVKIILETRPETFFLIVGSGDADYVAEIKQLVDDLQLNHRITFLGYRTDVADILAATTICAMPSYYEAFGLVALEAMAMAKPVIACRSGGVPEFLTDDKAGLLIPPHDYHALAQAVLCLLNDPQRARAMGKHGRSEVLAKYSSERYCSRLSALLKEMVPPRLQHAECV